MDNQQYCLGNEKIIAHRGLSSVFPENTLPAVIAALFCSDFAQIDVQLTKDNKVIVFHDRGLQRITNISQFPEFADRKKYQTIDHQKQPRQDYWVRDFSLLELKKLRVFQQNKKRPQLQNHNFSIITFEELLQQFIKLKNKYTSGCGGLLVEMKQQIAYEITERDKILCNNVSQLLHAFNEDKYESSIILQSFCIPILDFITTENRIIQLYDKNIRITENFLNSQKKPNVIGIGITENSLLNVSDKDAANTVVYICKRFNYEIFYWTLIDDDLQAIPLQEKNYRDAYLRLKRQGVTGFITEFPQQCRKYLGKGAIEMPEILQKSSLLFILTDLE